MARAFYTVDLLQGSVPFNGGAITGATTVNNGNVVDTSGALATTVEIQELAGGTATVAIQGSLDGITWYAVGFQQTDATASPARSVTAVSVLANAKHLYQILDACPLLRAAITAISAGSILARAYQTGQ